MHVAKLPPLSERGLDVVVVMMDGQRRALALTRVSLTDLQTETSSDTNTRSSCRTASFQSVSSRCIGALVGASGLISPPPVLPGHSGQLSLDS